MGTTASVLYNLIESDYAPPNIEEGTERPLVRRVMAREQYQQDYLDRYRELSEGILSASYLEDRLTALSDLTRPHLSPTDLARLTSNEDSTRSFIALRAAAVEAELAEW